MELSTTEVKQILVWAEHAIEGGHFGDGNMMIPEEEITRNKLINQKSGNIHLSRSDIKIIKYWAESTLGSSLRGMLPEEVSVIEKIKNFNQS